VTFEVETPTLISPFAEPAEHWFVRPALSAVVAPAPAPYLEPTPIPDAMELPFKLARLRPAPPTIRCRCGKTITVAEQHRGRTIRCVQCGRTMRVPQLDLRWWLTILAWSYLVLVSVAGLVLWGSGDRWWLGTVLLFMGRWVLLLPLLLLMPAALLLRRSLLLPLALGAFVATVPVAGFRFGVQRLLSHPPGAHLRVVTFNADGGAVTALELPNLLDDWKPDVVAFQECDEGLQQAVEHMKGWYHHTVRQLCLLSRDSIRQTAVMDRSALEAVKESSAGIGGSGDVVRYTVRTASGAVNITNLHLETPRKGFEGLFDGAFEIRRLRGNTRLRTIESTLARRWVDAGTLPTLVMGDFNTPVESRIFQESWGDFTDAFSRAGFGFGMTKYNGWIRVRIDHVLTGPGWYVDQVTTGRELGSDHLPVIVDLTLAPKQP
jgi:endonuclease/exonuclease/phosphatase (EEP) superfamily protein YafD